MRLLVVEDEQRLAYSLKRGLELDGFAVDVALDGPNGLWMAQEHEYDAIVLDVMLPGLSGHDLCGALREANNWVPILMLTAKDTDLDEASALDSGADDFLRKPFSHLVLVARLRALLRRGAPDRSPELVAGDLRVDPARRRCWRGPSQIELTAREFAVLEYLLSRAGDVVSRTDVMAHVWDYDFDGDSNLVDVYIRRLRTKIDLPFGRAAIETVRGAGYRLREDGG